VPVCGGGPLTRCQVHKRPQRQSPPAENIKPRLKETAERLREYSRRPAERSSAASRTDGADPGRAGPAGGRLEETPPCIACDGRTVGAATASTNVIESAFRCGDVCRNVNVASRRPHRTLGRLGFVVAERQFASARLSRDPSPADGAGYSVSNKGVCRRCKCVT